MMLKKRSLVISIENNNDLLSTFIENNFHYIKVNKIVATYKAAMSFLKKIKPNIIFLDTRLDSKEQERIIELCESKKINKVFFKKNSSIISGVFKNKREFYFFSRIKQDEFFNNYEIEEVNAQKEEKKDQNIDFIGIPSIEKIEIVSKSTINFITSDGKYTIFHLDKNVRLMSSKNIGHYESILKPDKRFVRIHHGTLINIDYVKVIHKKDGGYCEMKNGKKLAISRRKQRQLYKRLLLS